MLMRFQWKFAIFYSVSSYREGENAIKWHVLVASQTFPFLDHYLRRSLYTIHKLDLPLMATAIATKEAQIRN